MNNNDITGCPFCFFLIANLVYYFVCPSHRLKSVIKSLKDLPRVDIFLKQLTYHRFLKSEVYLFTRRKTLNWQVFKVQTI